MLKTAKSLRRQCVARVAESLIKAEEDCIGMSSSGPLLSESLAEEVLERIHSMEDNYLLSPLFNHLLLRRVLIEDASKVTLKGLRAIRRHRLEVLRVRRLKKCSINELIGCLGEQSLRQLRVLDVSHSLFTADAKLCVVVGLSQLKALQYLDVSSSDFNGHALDIVCHDLPQLLGLNLSDTRVQDLTPLRRVSDRLRWLSLQNMRIESEEQLKSLLKCHQLEFLDLSLDWDQQLVHPLLHPQAGDDFGADLLRFPENFPQLKSLDVSGRDPLDRLLLERFLHLNSSLEFLGLMNCQLSRDLELFRSHCDLIITGMGSEEQLKESLKRYKKRQSFVQKALFTLYDLTLHQTCPLLRPDLVSLITKALECNQKQIGVCMAATACLYQLTKNHLGDQLHPRQLEHVVRVTLRVMQHFPRHAQLQKNALLTLCSDRVLQHVSFDRFLCTRLVLDALVQFRHETAMTRMAVAVVSILAAKISTEETSLLGSRRQYMDVLLALVRQRVDSTQNPLQDASDVTLRFALSALWNLTDESPQTCHVFLERSGLELYSHALQRFRSETAVETKVLGLLNNIAEVESLRRHLVERGELIHQLRQLMRSQELDVSYFSVGIFAHLLSSSSSLMTSQDLQDVSEQMRTTVVEWTQPDTEMVAYRSFVPFLPLLDCFRFPSVQLWAIWAINHVCIKNPKRYCEMLIEEEALPLVKKIIRLSEDQLLKSWCERTLEVINKEFRNCF